MKYPLANKISSALIFTIVFALSSVSLLQGEIPQKPTVAYPINDYANILTNNQRTTLNNTLSHFADTTSNQIVVVTINNLDGMSPNQFATELGEQWGVGNNKFDNGIVLLIKPKTVDSAGEVYIAIGYGLEGAIPDIVAQQIIQREIIPRFKENDYYGGIVASTSLLMKLASGEISYKEWSAENNDFSSLSLTTILFIVILFILIFGKNSNSHSNGRNGGRTISSADAYIIGSILSGGSNGNWRGGGSFGGGGFSGGFGGGFGGGSFGGGGAGGSW